MTVSQLTAEFSIAQRFMSTFSLIKTVSNIRYVVCTMNMSAIYFRNNAYQSSISKKYVFKLPLITSKGLAGIHSLLHDVY